MLIARISEREPFGLELPGQDPSDNTHRFTGHERDTETNLDYMKARYYGASMGRFGAVDPYGGSVKPYLISSWNRYAYGNNSPVRFFDQNGKDGNDAAEEHWYSPSVIWNDLKNFFSNAKELKSVHDNGGITGPLVSNAVGSNHPSGVNTGVADPSLGSRAQANLAESGQVGGNTLQTMGEAALTVSAAGDAAKLLAAAGDAGAAIGLAIKDQASGKMAFITEQVTKLGLSQAGATAATKSAVEATGLETAVVQVGTNQVVSSIVEGVGRDVLVVSQDGSVVRATADLSTDASGLVIDNLKMVP